MYEIALLLLFQETSSERCGPRCSYLSAIREASQERKRERVGERERDRKRDRGRDNRARQVPSRGNMGGSRDGVILLILAVAWLRLTVGVEVHVAALNETDHPVQVDSIENEVSFSSDEMDQHPHMMPGKPSKLDTNINQMIQMDDRSQYQIEATRMENATAFPLESTGCQDNETTPCARKDLSDLFDRLSRIDTYNVTDSVQIIRNRDVIGRKDEKGNDRPDASLLDKVRRFAREHVVKIRLSQDLIPGRKARTFFNGESTERVRVTLS